VLSVVFSLIFIRQMSDRTSESS